MWYVEVLRKTYNAGGRTFYDAINISIRRAKMGDLKKKNVTLRFNDVPENVVDEIKETRTPLGARYKEPGTLR